MGRPCLQSGSIVMSPSSGTETRSRRRGITPREFCCATRMSVPSCEVQAESLAPTDPVRDNRGSWLDSPCLGFHDQLRDPLGLIEKQPMLRYRLGEQDEFHGEHTCQIRVRLDSLQRSP